MLGREPSRRDALEEDMTTVAFIGLGNMGGPMARNLLAAGRELSVFDLMPAARAELERAGAAVAETAAAAVETPRWYPAAAPAAANSVVRRLIRVMVWRPRMGSGFANDTRGARRARAYKPAAHVAESGRIP